MSESESYEQKINSIVEIMPPDCYKRAEGENNLHITDLGFKYLEEKISFAHFQAGHCISCKEGAYNYEAQKLAERIVFNKQWKHPELIKSDLNMSDLEDPNMREAKLMNFMLSFNGEMIESKVSGKQNQKKPNPMNQAGYFEE